MAERLGRALRILRLAWTIAGTVGIGAAVAAGSVGGPLKPYKDDLFTIEVTGRLFGGDKPMADVVRRHGRRTGELGGLPGAFAERYWTSVRV